MANENNEKELDIGPEGGRVLRVLVAESPEYLSRLHEKLALVSPAICDAASKARELVEIDPSLGSVLRLEAILEVVTGLHELRRRDSLPASELFESLERALARLPDDEAEGWTAQDRASWLQRRDVLLKLLSSEHLTLEAKANELLAARGARVQSVRIFTDVRPVFNDSGDHLQAAFLMNTLEVRYDTGSDEQRVEYFALEPPQLAGLLEQVSRAHRKNECLRRTFADEKITLMKHRGSGDESGMKGRP